MIAVLYIPAVCIFEEVRLF